MEMDTKENNTDQIESKSNESTQQGVETIEELINRKVEELLQTKPAKVINLTEEEVLKDWKEQEKTLKKSRIIPEKIDEQSINIVGKYLANEYLKKVGKYGKYVAYKLKTLQYASNKRLENSADNYLIKGLDIMRRQMMEFYSNPNVGKTFVSLEMAYKMAIGGWVFNTPEYAVTKPLKVLYMDNENGDILLSSRLDRMTMYNRDLANANIRLIQSGGVLKEDGTIEYLSNDRFGRIDENTDSIADPIIAITRATGFIPDVIFIDPLVDAMSGNENDTEDMSNFVRDIRKLIKNTGATVIINHHTKKDSTGNLYDARGSSVLAGALDIAVELRAEQKDKEEDEFESPLETEEDKNITKSIEDDDKTRKSLLSFHMTKNRTGPKLKSFHLGIFDTPIEELAFKPPADNAKIESGLLVPKIYRTKDDKKPPTAITLHMAEIVNLMYKKGLDPAKISTIQEEEYQEKIFKTLKTVRSYQQDPVPLKDARGRLVDIIRKYPIIKTVGNDKGKEEKDMGDNDKPINPFV